MIKRDEEDVELIKSLLDLADLLNESNNWLKHSYDLCKKIGIKNKYSQEEFDVFETLTSRFSRTSDMILQKVLRLIDKIELIEEGTLIDIMNRAEKRGILPDATKAKDIRKLRNKIAHQYSNEDIGSIFKDVIVLTPEIIIIIENINKYCQQFIGNNK